MFRGLKNKRAQALAVEYALVFFVVTGTLVAMTVYFKRGLQARVYDARNVMLQSVLSRTNNEFVSNLYVEYEPYYGNTVSEISTYTRDQSQLLSGGSSGIFRKTIDQTILAVSASETAPPKDKD